MLNKIQTVEYENLIVITLSDNSKTRVEIRIRDKTHRLAGMFYFVQTDKFEHSYESEYSYSSKLDAKNAALEMLELLLITKVQYDKD